MQSKPLVTCSYGWKRTFALYQDRIDVDGTPYALDDLIHVRSVCRTVLNIPSVRLELRFRKKDVVLRGIAAIEDAKRVIEYLDTYCADAKRITARLRWSRTRRDALQGKPPDASVTATTDEIAVLPEALFPHATPQASVDTADDRDMQSYAQVVDTPTDTPIETPVWLQDLEQHVVYTRQQRRIQSNRSLRRYGFDVQELAHKAESETLPSLSVPLRLLPQEEAHYCTNATLCNETLLASQEQRFTYTTADHGKLILTNKRIVYLGRTGQLVLDYAQITHVARLHNAIVFSADSWAVRHMFEVQRPLECAMYLDNILRQFQREAAQHTPSKFEPSLRQIHAHHTRTTQPRYAAHTHQTNALRHIQPAIELADIETLPLSLLKHIEMEVAE